MVVDIDYFFKQCPLSFLDLKILYKTVKAKKRTQFAATLTNSVSPLRLEVWGYTYKVRLA
jgi:hypothetical protein